MKRAKALAFATLLVIAFAAPAPAAEIVAEHVSGGTLDLPWVPGFGTPNTMFARTLDPSDPAYANPSGDHTVAVAQNAIPDEGGIIVTSTDPGALNSDYAWEAWFFTGNGDTRRGLILRATPGNDFQSFYMMVVESGLFRLRFRKIVDGAPTTIQEWFSSVLPAGSIPINTWHKMKVIAQGNTFRCFFDDFELTAAPIVDDDIAAGWVGVYNFRFDLGGVQALYDDLVLSCLSAEPVAFDLAPNTLNLMSAGRWVTGVIEPTGAHGAADVDVASIRLNGAVAVDPAAPATLGDANQNGIPDLAVKFARADLELALAPGDAVPVTVTGAAGGDCFEGTDVIRVIRPQLLAPTGGATLAAGTTTEIRWEVAAIAAPTVALLTSMDGGATWTIVARDLPNGGAYDWSVPAWPTTTARVAIVQITSDGGGDVVDGVLSVSDPFTIASPLAVGAGADFALRPTANPSIGPLRVSFTLPVAGTATLAAYEVSGRLVARRDLEAGPGTQTVTLADRAPAGLYIVRLSQGGRFQTVRLSVVR